MAEKQETAKTAAAEHPVQAKNLEPMAKARDFEHPMMRATDQETIKPARAGKSDKPQTLQQKLAEIHDRVEAASNSPVMAGKAEEFADCWEELDAIGTGDTSNLADASMIQAAHNHLQHRAPRRASRIDALEAQLDAAAKGQQKPEAVPDTPQMANVKAQIADLQTDIARDPRALPEDKQRAQELQHKVDSINAEKATK